MGTLLQKIVDPPTFNQIVRLPRDQQPVATVMAYCKFLGFPFDALVPNPEQFEGQFEEGTAEHRQMKLQRQAEIRQLSLTLTQQVKEAIEKGEKGGVVAKSSYVSPPSLNGSDPFFPHRTYGAKVRDFQSATRLPMEVIMTHLISHTVDEPTRQWLTTLQTTNSVTSIEDLENILEAKFNYGGVYDAHINSEIQRHATEENETLLDSLNRFHNYLINAGRPYLGKPQTPGSEADVLEQQDCTSFLNGQIPEDH